VYQYAEPSTIPADVTVQVPAKKFIVSVSKYIKFCTSYLKIEKIIIPPQKYDQTVD
jgi:hypothetical protein